MNPDRMLMMRRMYLARHRCRVMAWMSCGGIALGAAFALSVHMLTPAFLVWLTSASIISYTADKAAVFYADYRLWSAFQ